MANNSIFINWYLDSKSTESLIKIYFQRAASLENGRAHSGFAKIFIDIYSIF